MCRRKLKCAVVCAECHLLHSKILSNLGTNFFLSGNFYKGLSNTGLRCIVLDPFNLVIAGSNPIHGMNVCCVYLSCTVIYR
jgi:hypothetical protein